MKPIIQHLTDTDYYQFSVSNMFFQKGHADVPVKYEFKCRTPGIALGTMFDLNELNKQIDNVMSLSFGTDEIDFLRQQKVFGEDYLTRLQNIKLPRPTIEKNDQGFAGLTIEGGWFDTILWETYLLSILNQMYNSRQMNWFPASYHLFDDDMMLKGVGRLEYKIEELLKYPDIQFMEFGTRRRFSYQWQEYVIRQLAKNINGQLTGTSNVYFAMKYGLAPKGTMSHQVFMVYAALCNGDLKAAQETVLDDWWDTYGGPLSIALSDTWGTDFFFQNFAMKHAINWWGVRQDSGNPFEIGDKIIDCYSKMGIDPLGKMVVFSDGLTLEEIIKLRNYFVDRVSFGFGWGTSLTSDLGNNPLSLVIKPVEANGLGVVKLSDNIKKAIGKPADIAAYKEQIGYVDHNADQPVY